MEAIVLKCNFEKKFLVKYRDARKYIKDNKMTDGEAEDYLKTQGLLAADDTYSARETARDAWLRAGENVNKAYEGAKTSKVTAAAIKAGEYTIYKPAKFIAYDAPKWTLNKAWRIGSYPFRLVAALGEDIGKIGKKKDKGAEKSDVKDKDKDKDKDKSKDKGKK